MLNDLLAASSCVDHNAHSGPLTAFCDELVRNFADGHMKVWATAATLRFRRHHAALFQDGGYRPLSGEGDKSEHLVAFAREHEAGVAITAVPRFAYTLCGGRPDVSLAAPWGDTRLIVPAARYRNIFTGEILDASSGALLCHDLFGHFPIALLARS